MQFPHQLYITGKFVGVHPVKKVNDDFFTQDFAIDTEEKFNNVKVIQAQKTAQSAYQCLLSELNKKEVQP